MAEQYIPAKVRWEGSARDDYYLLGHGADEDLSLRIGVDARSLGQTAASFIVGDGKGPRTYKLSNPQFNHIINVFRNDGLDGDKRLWERHGKVKALGRREWRQFWEGFNENLAHSLGRRYKVSLNG